MRSVNETVEVTRGSLADVPALEPLWIAVHHRHMEAMPELAPYVSDAASWSARRALYAELMAKPETVLLLARTAAAGLVGYALGHVLRAEDTWLADTWASGPRIGEVESLAVSPAHRNRGIGTRLLGELERVFAGQGVTELILGVLPGNEAALRLYQRRGYRPTWMYLSRRAPDPG
jgi:ribosomal protein S18 acetylase RimI-like enzyme